ncbi:hypothetical protein [Simplicispira psychrophila]|uniref:hypothetical protein n=1 Tax=Simplicispira psychrophila TaxID=80882 RepID=UPI000485854F|nr:hypothetical protein [Simplicispira psychrophila]
MQETATSPAPSAQRTAWLLFAPPAALVGLRWLLQWQSDRRLQTPLLPLTPFAPPRDALTVLAPLLWGVVALCIALLATRWAGRRWGWRPVQRAGLALWLVLCVAGAGALGWHHLNLQGAQSLPPVAAEVLGSHFTPPSARTAGGTQLIVQVTGLDGPQQVLIDDPQAAQWRPGQVLLLQWVRGRSSGLFVTGWQLLPTALPAPAFIQVGALPQ